MNRKESQGRSQPRDGSESAPPAGGSRLRGLAVNLLVSFAALALFFGGAEVVLALLGVRPIVVDEDPYVGFQRSLKLFEVSESGLEMQTSPNKLRLFNRQTFPARKGPDSYRVFTLGGSTTYGRPYDDATSFSAWLRAYLGAVDPDRRWEVVNCGGISYASYRVALLMEELVDYEPDLFVIYSGNNEFLERRTYPELMAEPAALTRTRLVLQHSRLWSWARSLAGRGERQARERYELTGEVNPLLNNSAGLEYYHRDDAFGQQVLDHYRFNLRRMVDLARASGAEVILVTVPVNEADFSPFKSEHGEGLSRDDRTRVARLLRDASDALAAGDGPGALPLADRALALDPRYAESHFVRGRALMATEAFVEAERSFARAIAEDICPLRASDEINEAIVEAAEVSETGLVDFRALLKAKMEQRHGHGILGDELFLDHVHPTAEVHGELASALVDEMGAMGLLRLPPDWRAGTQASVEQEVLSRVDAEATAIAYKNLSKVLIWAGKNKEAEKYLRLAEESVLEDWEVHFNAAMVAIRERRDYETALERLGQALELRPDSPLVHDLLGVAYLATGKGDAAIAAGRRAVTLDPSLAVAWSNLSSAYYRVGLFDPALQAARRAVELDPDYAEAFNNLGAVQQALGQLEDALESLQRAIWLRGGDFPKAKITAGFVLGELGRLAEAKAYFLDAVGTNPEEIMARLGLSNTLLLMGEPAAALPHLARVLELDPQNQAAVEMRARALEARSSPPTTPSAP